MLKNILTFAVAALWLAAAPAGLHAFGAASAAAEQAPSLEKMLTFAIEDEYLARAEYRVIMGKFGAARPFSNIIKAEERHIKWLLALLKKYGFAAPADKAAALVKAPASMKEALEAGVKAEEENITMYAAFLGKELPADVRDVFERLKGASENHLAAFKKNLSRY